MPGLQGFRSTRLRGAVKPLQVGLIQYWFAPAGGMEQHVVKLSIALREHGLAPRIYTELYVPDSNEGVRAIRGEGISVQGPPVNAPHRNSWRWRLRSFYITHVGPVILRMASAAWYRGARHRARAMGAILKVIGSDNPTRLEAVYRLCLAHWRSPLDVVHVHGFRIEIGWALKWAHALSVPCVYTEHSSVNDWSEFEGMETDTVQLADVVTSVSAESARQLQSLTRIPGVLTIPHIVQPPSVEDLFVDERPVESIICVAGLTKTKGVDVLIEAFAMVAARFPELHLNIVGDGPLRKTLEETVERMGIAHRVRFHGRLPNHAVISLIRRSDLMVLPSYSEALPVSLLEGLSHARPVVACDTGGISEIVEHGVNGLLVERGQPTDLAKAIESVVSDVEGWVDMAHSARRLFMDSLYHESSAVDSVVSLYEKAIAVRMGVESAPVTSLVSALLSPHANTTPKLSVVIPTSGSRILDQTLLALDGQAEKNFEVIVVENGPASRVLGRTLHRYSTRLNLRYAYCRISGLNRARNIGCRHARAAIVSLLDDDCIPTREWTRNIIRAHEMHPDVAIIGGPIALNFKEAPPKWVVGPLRALLSELDYGERSIVLSRCQYLVGANLSFRRSIFEETGGFRLDFGPSAANAKQGCNDEIEFQQRAVTSTGSVMIYDPSVAVKHIIPPERTHGSCFRRRNYIQGSSDIDLMMSQNPEMTSRQCRRVLYDAFPISGWARRFQSSNTGNDDETTGTIQRICVTTHIAYLEGMQKQIMSKRMPHHLAEDIRDKRLRFYRQGLRRGRKYQHRPIECLFDDIAEFMNKERFSWARSERFSTTCVIGRVDFVKAAIHGARILD